MFTLSLEPDNRLMVEIGQQLMPIDLFVESLLSGKIKFCQYYTSIPATTARIYFPVINCCNCDSPYHYYCVQRKSVSCCGKKFEFESKFRESWPKVPNVEFEPEVQRVVEEYKNSSHGRNLYLGAIKLREQLIASEPANLAIVEPSSGIDPMRQWQNQSQRLINQRRHSKVSTLTFGCPWCDAALPNSLFGRNLESAIYLDLDAEVTVPRSRLNNGKHWCYSKQRTFCEP
ncbi:MAG: hypothetical protein KME12_19205 [Trichocoleus desertorum ATA4-8-CV12]|nr:hypothetical protein [Trichocoleus desertorum ATA4-8-CV12]